jgi:hypothetical protein
MSPLPFKYCPQSLNFLWTLSKGPPKLFRALSREPIRNLVRISQLFLAQTEHFLFIFLKAAMLHFYLLYTYIRLAHDNVTKSRLKSVTPLQKNISHANVVFAPVNFRLSRLVYFLACVFNTVAMMSSCLMLVFVVLLPAATYVGRYHIMVIIILGAAMLGSSGSILTEKCF